MLKKLFNVSKVSNFSKLNKQTNNINKFYFKSSQTNNSELKKFNESFLNPSQADYLEQMFDQWYTDKNSVPASWNAYFTNIARGADTEHAFSQPSTSEGMGEGVGKEAKLRQILAQNLKIRLLLDNYRTRGHEIADLDPLELNESRGKLGQKLTDSKALLDYKDYGFTEADLDKEFYIHDNGEGFTALDKKITLRNLLNKMQEVYCNKIGYQYMHLQNHEERYWIRKQIEKLDNEYISDKTQELNTARRLLRDHVFVNFLKNTFTTAKRFGSEGCDSFISGLECFVDECAQNKVEHVIIGMAHRGRINTLFNVVKKPAAQILAEFQGIGVQYNSDQDDAGDVKYHLGVIHEKEFPDYDNAKVRLTVMPNPSHLETVDPLVYGKVRATQDFIQDETKDKAIGILIHGDAAISGQGIVYETMQFQDLNAYKVGGMIHVVVNNQIGFTTVPQQNRTSLYCTDIAETVQAPVFHVNADAPDQVDKVMKLAFSFRQKFKKDVIVDIIGYRKHGHNELDQPMFTQPMMYKKVAQKVPVYEMYRDQLIKQGIWTAEAEQKQRKIFEDYMKSAYEESRTPGFEMKTWELKEWEKLRASNKWGQNNHTGIPVEVINKINESCNKIPDEFNVNPTIKKIINERYNNVVNQTNIDYGTAETLAFGSLLLEGYGVRITGQDVERGTFSHRHSKLNDQKEDKDKYFPLQTLLTEEQKQTNALQIANSNLSEYGVCGFEYGYALASPNNFVMWEAQFGDFANGAQIIFDNYLCSAESKWGTQNQLVINLPHGLDGQGSEHSSGRIERFTQLSSDDPTKFKLEGDEQMKNVYENCNIQIIMPSTPAQYFHALRRQMRRDFRKPLIIFSSKRLLKFRQAYSPFKDFSEGQEFLRVIHERYQNELVPKNEARKVILCSGQLFYDLLNARKERGVDNVHILRLEQICPFPYDSLFKEFSEYNNAEFVWAQEEHWNQGANGFVRPRIRRVLKKLKNQNKVLSRELTIISRKPSAAGATGSGKVHQKELREILDKVFE